MGMSPQKSGHDTDRALDLSMNPICSEEKVFEQNAEIQVNGNPAQAALDTLSIHLMKLNASSTIFLKA